MLSIVFVPPVCRLCWSSSIEMLSPLVHIREGPGSQASSDEPPPAALDVEEVHRIFKLRDIEAAGFIRGLNGVACDGRVTWISFLRYMSALANVRPLTEESRAAVMMAKKLFAVFDEEKQREVDLRALASGLAVRRYPTVVDTFWSGLVRPIFTSRMGWESETIAFHAQTFPGIVQGILEGQSGSIVQLA